MLFNFPIHVVPHGVARNDGSSCMMEQWKHNLAHFRTAAESGVKSRRVTYEK